MDLTRPCPDEVAKTECEADHADGTHDDSCDEVVGSLERHAAERCGKFERGIDKEIQAADHWMWL